MLEDALSAAPFTAQHIDPAFYAERQAQADVCLAMQPLDEDTTDGLLALHDDERRTLTGMRYALAMTQPEYLQDFDSALYDAVMHEVLPRFCAHVAAEAQDHLVGVVAMLAVPWVRSQAEYREWDAQVQTMRDEGRFRPVAQMNAESTRAWLRGDKPQWTAPTSRTAPAAVARTARPRGAGRPAGRPARRSTRSSAASGDSGSDDGGGEPAPGGFRRLLALLLKAVAR